MLGSAAFSLLPQILSEGLPHHDQRLSHSLVVDAPARGNLAVHGLATLTQEPDRVLSVAAYHGHELVEHPALVSLRRLPVPGRGSLRALQSSWLC